MHSKTECAQLSTERSHCLFTTQFSISPLLGYTATLACRENLRQSEMEAMHQVAEQLG